MPIYQFDCAGCSRRVDILFRSVHSTKTPVCPDCGSERLTKAIARVARIRTAKQRFEEIDQVRESAALGSGDIGSFARWARHVGGEYDEALGTNYRELAERAEAGEDPYERIDADHTFRHQVNERLSQLEGGASEAPLSDGGHDHVH